VEITEGRSTSARFWPIVERVLHSIGAGLVAGVVAGAVSAGGSRVAMRVAALMADPCKGLITANENKCGVFTLGGTAGLIIFAALFNGFAGGVLYAAVAPWLRPLGRWRGLFFGVALLAVLGFIVLEPTNVDFRRFGSPVVNVATFAVLFPIFGVIVAPVFDGVKSRLPALPPRRPIRWTALPGYAVMAFAVFAAGLFSFGTLGLGLVALVVLVVVHQLGENVTTSGEGKRPAALWVAYLVLLIPVLAGAINTARSLSRIIGT
jgi:MFS family permease